MLPNKCTTVLSDLKDFFTNPEKPVNSMYTLLNSLRLSERQLFPTSAQNNKYNNITKLLLLILYPLFELKHISDYKKSHLYKIVSSGKDVFYRLLKDPRICWRSISYKISFQLYRKAIKADQYADKSPICMIVDDTDLPKKGRRIELIGRIFSHVTHQSIIGFKGLFLGIHDGKRFMGLDFSLHGELGKNSKRPYGFSKKELNKRFKKQRNTELAGSKRTSEYFEKKTDSLICMVKNAISKGFRFDYLLADSWFMSASLVKFIATRRIKVHLLCGAKMGNTKYLYDDKELSAKQLLDKLKRSKKLRRPKLIRGHYSEAIVTLQGISVKLFFHKSTHKGNWHLLLTTNTALDFNQAYQIYATRWSIEVFFKEAKQYLGLGKYQSTDFDAQIAHTTICMIQYNMLSTVKTITNYQTIGGLLKYAKNEHRKLTLSERIYKIIIEILSEIATLFEIEVDVFMEKLIAENQLIEKYLNIEKLDFTG